VHLDLNLGGAEWAGRSILRSPQSVYIKIYEHAYGDNGKFGAVIATAIPERRGRRPEWRASAPELAKTAPCGRSGYGESLASELTSNAEGDASLVSPLLDQIGRPIGGVLTGGAYAFTPICAPKSDITKKGGPGGPALNLRLFCQALASVELSVSQS
jgi:hypothetical protein